MLVLLRIILFSCAAIASVSGRGSGSSWWNQWKAEKGITLVNREVFSLRGSAALRIVNDPSAMGINAVAAAAAGDYGQ